MTKMFTGMILSLLKLCMYVLIPVMFVLVLFLIIYVINLLYLYFVKGIRITPRLYKPIIKRNGFFKRIFVKFPRRLALDVLTKDYDMFTGSGLHLICGEQGSGKTVTLIKMLLDYKREFPAVKIRSNMDITFEDAKLTDWRDLVDNNNGIYGQIEVIDEIQNWFSSMDSKDFPPEMLCEISQQRKQIKMIMGTSQVFSRVAKPIREQVQYVYCPMTFLGCFTIVRKTHRKFWDDNKQQFKRWLGWSFFVHDEEIRNSFDTYKKIKRLKAVGFSERKVININM